MQLFTWFLFFLWNVTFLYVYRQHILGGLTFSPLGPGVPPAPRSPGMPPGPWCPGPPAMPTEPGSPWNRHSWRMVLPISYPSHGARPWVVRSFIWLQCLKEQWCISYTESGYVFIKTIHWYYQIYCRARTFYRPHNVTRKNSGIVYNSNMVLSPS